MGDLSYKELQEKGVFDVPYKAFQFMQEQQAIIDDLRQQLNNMEQCYIGKKKECEGQQKRIDDVEAECKDWHRSSGSGLAVRILGVLRGAND